MRGFPRDGRGSRRWRYPRSGGGGSGRQGDGSGVPPGRRVPYGRPAGQRLPGHPRDRDGECPVVVPAAPVSCELSIAAPSVFTGISKRPPPPRSPRSIPATSTRRRSWRESGRLSPSAGSRVLPVTVIRPCAIYGPGDMRLLKLFRIASRRIKWLLGDGRIFYHMVYVDDLSEAFLLAATRENVAGKTFIIGGRKFSPLTSWSISLRTNWARPGGPSTFRWHRSGSLPGCANACALRSTFLLRSIVAASIFSPSPVRSTFAGLRHVWGTPHR